MSQNSYYQYRQKDYAEKIYLNGFQSRYVSYELRLVALYMKLAQNMRQSELRDHLKRFCADYAPNYSYYAWCMRIKSACDYAANHDTLVQIDSVPIFKSELAYITSLSGSIPLETENIQRTVFAMMVHKKLDKYSYEQQHDTPYAVFSYSIGGKRFTGMPRIAGLRKPKNFDFALDVLYPMHNLGLIETIETKGSPLKLNFADEIRFSGDFAFNVQDYEQLGLYYDKYILNKPVGFCVICGRAFKQIGHRPRLYCDEHKGGNIRTGQNVFSTCVDCGQIYIRNSHAAQQIRCRDCQKRRDQRLSDKSNK